MKAGPPPLPPSPPHPVLSSWLFPRRPQGFQANYQTTGCWNWLSGTSPPLLCPLQLHPLCGSPLSPLPGGEGPWPLLCYSSTCRGIHLKPVNSLCLRGACRGAKGFELSCISEPSVIPIRLCTQALYLEGRHASLSNSSKRGPHPDSPLSTRGHCNPILCLIRETMMRNDRFTVARDGNTSLFYSFNISTFY